MNNVQNLQRWVGMDSVDNKNAQDGILGPITTKNISDFVTKCTSTPSGPENTFTLESFTNVDNILSPKTPDQFRVIP